MPRHKALESRWINVKLCLNLSAETLDNLAHALGSASLRLIALTIRSILTSAENVKKRKKECVELLESTYGLLSAIIILHMDSGTPDHDLPPGILNHLSNFTLTVNKIHSFIDGQREYGRIKSFLHYNEKNTLYKACQSGLKEALNNLKVMTIHLPSQIERMQEMAEKQHREALAFIERQVDSSSMDGESSVNRIFSSEYSSANSLAMLPPRPKIFHGRQREVTDILRLFASGSPRIAILGGGGMGKTSLVREVLHQSEIGARFAQQCYFVACDSATGVDELIINIAIQLGLQPSQNLRRQVLHHLSRQTPSLLVLDNLETVWEPMSLRAEVEELLSLFTDIEHLALIVTMRGAERPAKVQWTRPFIPPLQGLNEAAALNIFVDIADEGHAAEDIKTILLLTANIPLVITLMAHLVESEGCQAVLDHWAVERTSLISDGHDKRSSLDISISLSLSSPRMTSHAAQLLSLLSFLPDGLSEVELLQARLPIPDLLQAAAALIRTSMAFITDHGQFKVLVPIREYMQKFNPPEENLVRPLFKLYQALTNICTNQWGMASNLGVVTRLQRSFANIQGLLLNQMHRENPANEDMIDFIVSLNSFSRRSGRGPISLMAGVLEMLPRTAYRLRVVYATELLMSSRKLLAANAEKMLIEQILEDFDQIVDADLHCNFLIALATRYHEAGDISGAMGAYESGLGLLKLTHNPQTESRFWHRLAYTKWQLGDYSGAQTAAQRAFWSAQLSGNFDLQAAALTQEALCARDTGRYDHSITLSTKAIDMLALSDLLGGERHQHLLTTQGQVHMLKSEYPEAHSIYSRINGASDRGSYLYAGTSLNLVELELHMGVSESELRQKISAARKILCDFKLGSQRELNFCLLFEADLDSREGKIDGTAKTLYERYLQHEALRDVELQTYCLERLASISQYRSSNNLHSRWPIILLAHSVKYSQILWTWRALQFLAQSAVVDGDEARAVSLFTVALHGFTQMDVHRSRAECMRALGDIAHQRTDFTQARELWSTARPLFVRSAQDNDTADIDRRLASLDREGI